jgi:hypothetical protein
MPLDPKEFEKVFANHFETIEPEQFLDNLKAACPYLFKEDSIATTDVIVLPRSNDLKDTPLRIDQAVQTISNIEDRSLNAVVADIEKVKASS